MNRVGFVVLFINNLAKSLGKRLSRGGDDWPSLVGVQTPDFLFGRFGGKLSKNEQTAVGAAMFERSGLAGPISSQNTSGNREGMFAGKRRKRRIR